MNNKLLWVIDSPYSRSIKWLLLNQNVNHDDHIMTWDSMVNDELLLQHNPKIQVPTLILNDQSICDSLLIALKYLPSDWHLSIDATFFRLADSDIESAIIFLFRANLLKNKFGESEHSKLMFDAGVSTYKKSVDYLLDVLLVKSQQISIDFGLVLLYSTLLAASSISGIELINYRINELISLFDEINNNFDYQRVVETATKSNGFEVPFCY